ncbi:hypothetical protein ABFS82_04G102700 [Erythranthe guttata]
MKHSFIPTHFLHKEKLFVQFILVNITLPPLSVITTVWGVVGGGGGGRAGGGRGECTFLTCRITRSKTISFNFRAIGQTFLHTYQIIYDGNIYMNIITSFACTCEADD